MNLQRAAGNSALAGMLAGEERSRVLDVVGHGGGRPMDDDVRADMETRLGADFSDIRVHTDSRAASSAQAISATAYTVGNEVVFGNGGYDPASAAGRRTLAHELAHVIQQRSGPVDGTVSTGGIALSHPSDPFERAAVVTAEHALARVPERRADTSPSSGQSHERRAPATQPSADVARNHSMSGVPTSVQRNVVSDFLDEASTEVSDAASSVTSSALDVASTIGSKADAVTSAAEDLARDAGSAIKSAASTVASEAGDLATEAGRAIGSGVDAVGSGISTAASWAATKAGGEALSAVQWLAGRFGAKVTVVGSAIRVDIPDIPLIDAHRTPVKEMPRFGPPPVPLFAVGGSIGPVLFAAGLFAELAAQPRAAAVLGPVSIRRVSLVVDPFAGTGSATGQLHIAGSGAVALSVEAGLDAAALVIIMAGEVPIPIEADVFGGLRLTLQLTGLGSLDETVALGYADGALSLDLLNQLSLGARLDARLDAAAEVSVEGLTVCEYVWPLKSWFLTDVAEQFSFPLSVGYSSSGPSFSAGPGSAKPIPIDLIDAVLPQWVVRHGCRSMAEIIDYLCKRGVLPPEACTAPAQGPSDLPVKPETFEGGEGQQAGALAGGGAPSGRTRSDPIPLVWFKPIFRYPDPIRLQLSTGGTYDYEMAVPGQQVEPGQEIGVEGGFFPKIGKRLRLEHVLQDDDRGPAVDRFRRLLMRHGRPMTNEDADHVQDLGWGGYDRPENLWPLDAALNRRAGSAFQNYRITYAVNAGEAARPETTNVTLGKASKAHGPENVVGRWFRIDAFQNP